MTNPMLTSLVVSLVGSAAGAGLVTALVRAYKPKVIAAAASLGASAGSYVSGLAKSATFRDVVNAELRVIAANAPAEAATAKAVAAKILATVAPKFPSAALADVLDVISESVQAFSAGLAPAS